MLLASDRSCRRKLVPVVVTGSFPGFIDTDMTSGAAIPKAPPRLVADRSLDGWQAERTSVVPDRLAELVEDAGGPAVRFTERRAMKVTPGVTRTPVLPGASADGVRVDRFGYPPGGHTHWHLHTGEQVLYGESGRGWVQFAGKDRIMLESGGIVHVPVGLRHWHGAMPDSALVHLAVTAGGGTQWLGDVSAEEYAGDCGFDVAEPDDPLPASQTGDVVQCFLAAVARKDMSAALGLVTDDIVYDNVPIGTVTGPDGVRGALSRVLKAADRLDWITRHQVAAGDLVMNERLDRFHMDGRWVEVPVAGLFLLRNGKIALWRDYFDLATYQRQTPP